MRVHARGDWRGQRVFITGAGGFIASRLASTLVDRGAGVVGLVRDTAGVRLLRLLKVDLAIEVVRGDLGETGLVQRVLNEYEIDTVFHLAAQAMVGVANRSPLSTFESNVAGTWRVLEAARLTPSVERVVVASSDKAYGTQRSLPYTEETSLDGSFPYDASKACADIIARSYAVSFPLPVVVARCANVYGPGDLNWSRLLPGVIRAAIEGHDPVIRSDGTPERDYIYLSDAVEAYIRLAESLPETSGQAFNFGTNRPESVLGLVERVLELVGCPGLRPRLLGSADNEIDRQRLSSEKARRVLGWQPQVPLAEGLATTVAWYQRYLAAEPAREALSV